MANYMWIFGYASKDDPEHIRISGAKWDGDAMEKSRDYARRYDYVSATYSCMSKESLTECIKRDGWWFVEGRHKED